MRWRAGAATPPQPAHAPPAASLIRDASRDSAELGIGRRLAAHLLTAAPDRGITVLTASVRTDPPVMGVGSGPRKSGQHWLQVWAAGGGPRVSAAAGRRRCRAFTGTVTAPS